MEFMRRRPSGKLLEILLATIEQLENDTDFGMGNPTVTELKRILVLHIAELEATPIDTSLQVNELPRSETPLTILRMR